MKLSNIILMGLAFCLITGLIASNIVLKSEFDHSDKNDYKNWRFEKILEKPFKHVKIAGGNVVHVIFEPNKSSSVRINKYMNEIQKKETRVSISNDTLYLSYPVFNKEHDTKNKLRYNYSVRIFSPEILSVTASNANIELDKLEQKNLTINLSGNSGLGIQSKLNEMNQLLISLQDSSKVYMKEDEFKKSAQTTFQLVQANLKGRSILNLGRAKIKSLQLSIDDNSAIQLSGEALREFAKSKE